MPLAEFNAHGDRCDLRPTAAVVAGQVIALNHRMCVVACTAIAANALGAAFTEGIFKLPKESCVFVPGDDVFWDEDAQVATAAEGVYFGKALPVPAVGDPTCSAEASDDYVYAKLQTTLEAGSNTSTGTGTAPDNI